MIKLYLRLLLLLLVCTQPAWSQGVLDPNDPVVTYNPSNPPSQPAWGSIGKWVRTVRVSWNSDLYKCYVYKGMQFRLKYPKNFNPADTSKKYPIIVFFHGIGEDGSIYDNEYQLYHGGQKHMNAVESGAFDGFLLYPQVQYLYFGNTQYDYINELINNFFVPQLNVDPFRVMVEGLSGGGAATWDFLIRYPKLTAAATPISAALYTYDDYIQTWKYMPLWHFQGGVDKNPAPAVAQSIEASAQAAGANYKLKVYPTSGHGIWNTVWNEADYFPFMSRAHKANPWPLFGRTEFCPGEPVNATLGLTAGFDAYEWRKNGTVISGANSNTLAVTSFGTYDARIRSGSRWSPWSPIPVVIKEKAPTVTPNIQMEGLQSNVLPTPEGKDSVVLSLPEGYAAYRWLRSGSSDTLGTERTFTARTAGNYVALVRELYGCSSSLSQAFAVVNAAGTPAPDAASSLLGTGISKTQIRLNWSDKPSPLHNETAFEIYRAPAAGGPYTLTGKVNADVLTFTDNGLAASTTYYYIVRAVNNNGAAAVSNEASATTLADTNPPTAPGSLTASGSTRNSVFLTWTAATDDVGIDKYDIYINGKKTYTVPATTTSFAAYGLTYQQVYTFAVKARDVSGNESPASNQVSAAAVSNGLAYKYYHGSWTTLPNFNTLTPVKTGIISTVSNSPRTQTDNFGFVWEGYINIPVSGNYTFETYSDDGSKVYIGTPKYDPAATPLVNNDGVHGVRYREGTINLTQGMHPIVVTYFDGTGSDRITLYWKNTAHGVNSRQAIPASAFQESISLGAVPTAPNNVTVTAVSHNKLRINWNDRSNNETGFEVYRSTSSNGTYSIITTTGANVTSYTDSSLNANTNYYYRLKAINTYGSSAFSSTATGKTQPLPTIPAAPTNLVGTAVSGSGINLVWNDNSTNETAFEVYRSANNTSNYVLIATLAANAAAQASYADSGLFANAVYYYRVRAKNDGGNSAYTNAVNVTTLNALPAITGLSDKTMRYGTQLSYDINATDPDEEEVTLTTSNVPAFGTVASNGNGGILLTFSPGAGDQGVYSNIQVTATDQHGGVTNETFTLTVNNNYVPALNPIANVTLAEKAATIINLSSSDANGSDPTNWTATGLPAFANLAPEGNTAQLQLTPGYADAGTYPVTIKVDDGKGGFDTQSFTITVTDVNPNYALYINFTDGALQAGAPWNNTNKRPVQNDVFPDLKDNAGNSTGIALNVLSAWQNINGGVNTNNAGAYTGNNSGVYPDNVMGSNWWTTTVPQNIRFTGLNSQYKYSFTFFGSRAGLNSADNRIAGYTINGSTVTLNATNNSTQTITISNVRPDAQGGINIDMEATSGTFYAYLSAMVITATLDDSSAPAKPGHFAARNLGSGVRLSWTDQAYNETAYEIYRASAPAGPFTLLHTGAENDTAYTDATAASSQTWYYTMRALNGYGASPYTDTISISIPNKAPALAAIADVVIKTDATQQVALTATDAPGDVITLSATGLPGFITLQDNGNGNGTLNLAPTSGDIGKYTVEVKATDDKGNAGTQTFAVQVTDKNITSIYVNCNQVEPAGAPWNNFNALPNVNAGITNLKDETGAATSISVTVLDIFSGANNVGAVTGDESGVYPDAVMHTFFYDQSNSDRRIRISGLSAARKYNLVFFGSREAVADNRNTTYGAGGQTVTLNAASNTSNTVQLNGLTPDASGNIIFTVRQASGSFAAYLNALVIQSYVDDGTPLAPSNLTAVSDSRSSIRLNWADKSNNETGYQVWRSAAREGTYSLIATVGANVTTYTNTGLTENTVYYYKVRAVAGVLNSGYSNIVAGGTMAYGMYVNFTTTNLADAPWTNTGTLPYEGQSWNNLRDDAGSTTSVSLSITSNFTGTNPAGMQTGNNTGVYPDKVLAESYYTETDTARMLLSGLDQAKRYSFTFLGSRASGGTRITAYAIGSKVVTLDANDNTQNTVTINDVTPDGNGEIVVTVYTVLNYGYLNAMVVKAYPPEDSSNLQSLPYSGGTMARSSGGNVSLLGAISGAVVQPASKEESTDGITVENVYPNPFSNFINLYIRQQQPDTRVLVRLLDINGRLVMVKDLGIRGSGQYLERLELGNKQLNTGLYLLQILSDGKPVKTIKLMKH
ncbi:fibronectin type III domain-containing protein [Chitinophaga japonensis]|uniref:Fibronectin type III domain protein n=1 Tax=Chitinophaga japonensis TaxID=104662 RepID=A0A562SM67_CHIJA|nr:fibronectin type III domain-containing protein [Chitinophaga japonensis]TWI82372.1 fibronectin type III domain protein [Chitinophaga japonensis]